MSIVKEAIEVAKKDIKSEIRTRYNIISLILFVLSSVTALFLSIGEEPFTPELSAGILWILMIFGSMTGLARSFVAEEERGTKLLLQLSCRPLAVYFGKLSYNLIIGFILNTVAFTFFAIMMPVTVGSYLFLGVFMILATIGLSCASTIISAIISQSNGRAVLYPVLAFPILLPVLITCIDISIEAFSKSVTAFHFDMAITSLSYSIILVALSAMLFEFVWSD